MGPVPRAWWVVALVAGCGSRGLGFEIPDAALLGGNAPDAATTDARGSLGAGDGGRFGSIEGGVSSGVAGSGGNCASHPTDNLCAQVADCSAQGKPGTTISGVVYTPSGKLPLYDVFVYVPNAPLGAIKPGNPTCSQCQASASGNPIVWTQTDASGKFVLNDVPSGNNIPLVMQVGKWRRAITIATVTSCTDNPQSDPNQTRLPANGSEGDMPLIAFVTGYDPGECFLRDMGIADSEFGPPGSNSTHVHLYTGHNDVPPDHVGPTIAGGGTVADTYDWWTNSANLLKYDMVYETCEGAAYARGAGAYQAVHDYVEGGGRFYGTHWSRDWITTPTDWAGVATWQPPGNGGGNNQGNGGGTGIAPPPNLGINVSFPKGKALADWLQATGVTTTYAQLFINDTRDDVTSVVSATDWAHDPVTQHPKYMSFNAPVSAPTSEQCGRAVFSDMHVAGQLDGDYVFPAECAFPNPAYATNEKVLAFLFFDVASCVQDESEPPPSPPQTAQ